MSEIIDIVEPAIPGSKGDQGPAGEIVDATATALPTGAEPTVTLGGTPSERTIEFGLPRGPKGDPGDGSVNSVNGDLGPDVVLGAVDVGAVATVNGKTGPDVVLGAVDVGAVAELAYTRRSADARLLRILREGRTIFAFAGPSTVSVGGYPTAFARQVHGQWRSGYNLTLAEATGKTFGSGVHVVNAGSSGKNARNYLADGRSEGINALNVDVVVHTIGINDWNSGRTPSVFAQEVEDAVATLTSSKPLIHIFVHEHERNNIAIPTQYTWDDFGEALKSVADLDPANRIYVDASGVMRAAGVGMGLDNRYGLCSADGTHLTDMGQGVMGEVVARLLGIGGSAPSEWYSVQPIDATGICRLRYNAGRIELEFDITLNTPLGVNASVHAFTVPTWASPSIITQINVGSTGGAPYGGYVASTGAVQVANASTSSRPRFWGNGSWVARTI